MIEVGERVFVRTFLFSGFATVEFVNLDEFFGIQVLLEIPDEDGHRIKRVSLNEINQEDNQKETETAQLEFNFEF